MDPYVAGTALPALPGPSLLESPRDGQAADAPLVFKFSEAIRIAGGTLSVRGPSGWVHTEVLTGNASITVSGATLTYDPPQRLAYGTSYSIEFSGGAITDLQGNAAHYGSGIYSGFRSGLSPVAVQLTGTAGTDTLEGSDQNDTLDGAGGDDTLNGYGGDDLLIGGDEVGTTYIRGDRLWGGNGNDTLRGGSGDDLLEGDDGNDNLYGGADNDRLTGGRGNDRLEGGAGNDSLEAGEGHDLLFGGDGNDTLDGGSFGTTGTLDGGAGDDHLRGWSGLTYLGGLGDDTINAGINQASGSVTIDGGDGKDTIHLTVYPNATASVTLSGGAGSDTYVLHSFGNATGMTEASVLDFGAGSGGDRIDFRQLLGLQSGGNPFDDGRVRLVASGVDTRLEIRNSADSSYGLALKLNGVQPGQLVAANFAGGYNPLGGTTGETLVGTDAGESLQGSLLDDVLRGLGGDDYLSGNQGNDTLEGGDGNDSLSGNEGNNKLYGGAGNDTLNAGSGGTNLLEGGAGNDYLSGGQGQDSLDGGEGNDELLVSGPTYGSGQARSVVLAGGGGSDKLVFQAGTAETSVRAAGGDGADVFEFLGTGAGVTITDFSPADKLDLTKLLPYTQSGNPFGSAGYLKAVQEGADLRIYVDRDGAASGAEGWVLAATLANTSLASLGAAQFAGGFDPSGTARGLTLVGTPLDDVLSGDALDDTIDGRDGADRIEGRAGDDLLSGGDESVLGIGDTLSGGLGNDILRGGTGGDQLSGDEGDDKLFGDAGDDRLDGGTGNDTLEGGEGNDSLSDGDGTNILRGGAGNDHLSASGWQASALDGGSTLDGGAGDDVLMAGWSVSSAIAGTGNDHIEIESVYGRGIALALKVEGGDGNDSISIRGGSSEQRQITVSGGAGTDTYSYQLGSSWAALTITDFQAGAGGDVIKLPSFYYQLPELNPFGASGYARLVQDGGRVLLQVDADGAAGPAQFATAIVFENASATSFTSANFTEGMRPDGSPEGFTLGGGAAPDTIEGGRLDDTLRGLGGGDTLRGHGGNDRLHGDDGNDTLEGGNGADTLEGGAGDDYLRGEGGNDELRGGIGKDMIGDDQGDNRMFGGEGDDQLVGSGAGQNQLYGEAGNDSLSISSGGLIDGGDGDDSLSVGSGYLSAPGASVQVRGGAGRDALSFFLADSGGQQVLAEGGAGIDTYRPINLPVSGSVAITDFTAGKGGDLLDVAALASPTGRNPFAPEGNLRLLQRGGDTVLQGKSGSNWLDVLTIKNVAVAAITPDNLLYGFNPDGSNKGLQLIGGAAAERLEGGWIDDRIDGGGGNDTLVGGMGDDHLLGGDGNDRLSGDEVAAIPQGQYSGPWQPGRTGHDRLEGGAGDDTLTSSWGNDILLGGAGNDRLSLASHLYPYTQESFRVSMDGGDGADHLGAGYSNFTLTLDLSGGAGSDTFEFSALPNAGGGYTVLDFQTGAGGDVLDIFQFIGTHVASPFAVGYFRFDQRGADTVVQVDRDAKQEWYGFEDLVTLKNVTASALTSDNMRYGYLPGTVDVKGDTRTGGVGRDSLAGGAANDRLEGAGGNDLLQGGGGNDYLDGGDGLDTARYGGLRAEYTLRSYREGRSVGDMRGGAQDGMDILFDVERLVFADGGLAFDLDGVAGQAYRIYRAAFDRTPDEAGLGYWMALMDQGASLATVASGFAGSREFLDLYGAAPSNAEIVARLYQNILHRTPEQAGYDYWLGVLNSGATDLAGLLAAFSESGENRSGVAALIADGIAYQPYG